jgi:hypothetical protein
MLLSAATSPTPLKVELDSHEIEHDLASLFEAAK